MSSNISAIPELRQIIGSLIFAAKEPLSIKQIRKNLIETAQNGDDSLRKFARITEREVREETFKFRDQFNSLCSGILVQEVANGFRLVNASECGPWVRQLLEKSRATRLSKSALETLAVIAYRQPCTRTEIESIRGVSVDSVVRNLVELQLIKAVGRSELPGKPWLFATTNKFLEHFGLNSLSELPNRDDLAEKDF